MRLSLGADAAPHLSLDAMWAACMARGLDGIELAAPSRADEDAFLTAVRSARMRVTAIRVERAEEAATPRVARLARQLRAPVVADPDVIPRGALGGIAELYASVGARLLVGHATHLDDVRSLASSIERSRAPHALGLAWEVRPLLDPLSDSAAILLAASPHLGLVRLHGGGPEQSSQDGRGIGALVVDLALSGYEGDVVVRPSSDAALPDWRSWLSSRGSSGCGTRAEAIASHHARELDVRHVEPKDRLEAILGAYHALAPGRTLKLTVDHDPQCMYYTLTATEPAGAFSFRVVERGPLVWRVEVTKIRRSLAPSA